MARLPPHLSQRRTFLWAQEQPPAIPSVFAEADVFCLPSRHDGWGVVVNEALGAGLPIVASDGVGAAHDLVQHGRSTATSFPPEDARALAGALSRLGRRRRTCGPASQPHPARPPIAGTSRKA